MKVVCLLLVVYMARGTDLLLDYATALARDSLKAQYNTGQLFLSGEPNPFNYEWRSGPIVNSASLDDFSTGRHLDPSRSTFFPCLSSLPTAFFVLLGDAYYQLGTKDTTTLAEMEEYQKVLQDKLLDEWSIVFGPIPGNHTGQLMDAYWNMTVAKWICHPNRTVFEYLRLLESKPALVYVIFDCAGGSAPVENTIGTLFEWFGTTKAVDNLLEKAIMGNAVVRDVRENLMSPARSNGGMFTSEGGWVPGWELDKAPYEIYEELHNASVSSGYAFVFHLKKLGNSSYECYVNGMLVKLPEEIETYVAGLAENYYMYFNTSFSAHTVLSIAPMGYDVNSNSGWWKPEIVWEAIDARKNETKAKEESGYRFASSEFKDTSCLMNGVYYFLVRGYQEFMQTPFSSFQFVDTFEPYHARLLYVQPFPS